MARDEHKEHYDLAIDMRPLYDAALLARQRAMPLSPAEFRRHLRRYAADDAAAE